MIKKRIKKIGKYILWASFALVIFIFFMLAFLLTPWGQKKVSDVLVAALSDTFQAEMSGKISYKIPNWIKIEDFLIKDLQKDTLLYAKNAYVGINMLKLYYSQIDADKIELNGAIFNVNSNSKGVFNYQFLLDALPSDTTNSSPSSIVFSLPSISLNDIIFNYKDGTSSSINLKWKKLKTGFKEFKPDVNRYFFSEIFLEGLDVKGFVTQNANPSPNSPEETPSLNLGFGEIQVKDSKWNLAYNQYRSIGHKVSLSFSGNGVDLIKQKAQFKEVQLFGQRITFKDNEAFTKSLNSEVNMADLDIKDLRLQLEDLEYQPNEGKVKLVEGSFIEKSGLALNRIFANMSFKNQEVDLRDFEAAMNGSKLSAELNLKIDTLNGKKSSFRGVLKNAQLAVKDLGYFSESLLKNEYLSGLRNDNFKANAQFSGDFDQLFFQDFNLLAPLNSRIKAKGFVRDFENPKFDMVIHEWVSNKTDVLRILPGNVLPSDFSIPNEMRGSGTLKGDFTRLEIGLKGLTTDGNLELFANVYDLNKVPGFKGTLILNDFNSGKIIGQKDLGTITASLLFDGKGNDLASANLKLSGVIKKVYFQNNQYENISFEGVLKDKIFDTFIDSDATGAQFTWKGQVDLNNPEIGITGDTKIEAINLKTLGFTSENIELKGDLDLKQLKLDVKNPLINLAGRNVKLYKDNRLYPIGTISIQNESVGENRKIEINTDFINLTANGNFDYDQLKDVLLTEINHYFNIPDFKPLPENYNYLFRLKGKLIYNEVITAFLPAVRDFSPIELNALLRSDGNVPISGNIKIPYLLYDTLKVNNTFFDFFGDRESLSYQLKTEQISNPSFRLRNATIDGSLKDNLAEYRLSVKDSLENTIHALHGYVKNIDNTLRLSFDESGSKLFYEDWSGNPYGFIDYSSAGITINEVIFSSGNQLLRVHTPNETPNGPIHLVTNEIDLNFLAKALLQDSTIISGFLDADLNISNFMDSTAIYSGDFSIENLKYTDIELGLLTAKANVESEGNLSVNAKLSGENIKLVLDGTYDINNENSFDLVLNSEKIDAKVIEIFTKDVLSDISGEIKAQMNIKGSIANPELKGDLSMKDFNFTLVETGAPLKIPNHNFIIESQQISIENLLIEDAKRNTMNLNGFINLSQLPDYAYNLKIISKDFHLIKTKEGKNELYYGDGFINSDLVLKGKNLDFNLTGDIKISDATQLTLLLPDESSVINELNTIIEFIDFDQKVETKKVEKQNTSSAINFANAVNINVEITEGATLNILMDPITGDLLTVKGNGKITTGFDNKGDLFLLGQYDIVEGKYNLTYQIIKKEFEINQNSKSFISWTGDPMNGNLNITAEYQAGTKSLAGYPFTEESLKTNKISLPLRVDLVLTGLLSSPIVNFEMVLKENDIGSLKENLQNAGFKVADNKGVKLAHEVNPAKAEQIKDQAIMMLITGAFNIDNLGDNLASGGNYENFARKKASDLINSQLNKYASGIIKGIDLDFGLQSGYNMANDSRNTNLSLGVKKKFANDRLILSVGKNFELENKDMRSDEIFDNIQANWIITKDGRYRLNVFRKNLNQMVVEGSVVETGLGFIVAIDYETWKELTKRK